MKTWLPIHHEHWQKCLKILADKLADRVDTAIKPALDTVVHSPEEPEELAVELPESTTTPEPIIETVIAPVTEAVETIEEVDEPIIESETETEESVEVVASTEVEYEAESTVIELPEETMTAHFFSVLPWDGKSKPRTREQSAQTNSEPSTVPSNISLSKPKKEPASSTDTAKGFFARIPWDGSLEAGDEIARVHVSAAYDDKGLDPRSGAFPESNLLAAGMMSAARTSDRMSSRNENNQKNVNSDNTVKEFFAVIPWNN